MEEQTGSQTVAKRVRAVRKRAKLSRAELANRLVELGFGGLTAGAIGELERGTRRITVDDWLALAAALGVAPIHLLVPFEDEERFVIGDGEFVGFNPTVSLRIGENLTLIPLEARPWIRGTALHTGADIRDFPRYYVDEVPPARKYEIERERARLEGDDPGPPSIPEGKVPRLGVVGPEGFDDLPAPVYALLFMKEEK